MNSIFLPKEFEEKYRNILKNEYKEFLESCNKKIYKSFILNTIKTNNISFLNKLNLKLEEVGYIENAYFIKSEVSGFGNLIEQNIGLFQMQDISSMLPAIILNPKETDIVLDLTAAPGNKTAILAQIMKNKGLIMANDVDKKRIRTLIYTLKKQGITNTIVTNQNGITFASQLLFDKILLDAPCSCEGMIQKKKDILVDWSKNLVKSKSELQKKLIINAYRLLKKNGILVYSTCALSPEENEEVIDFLLTKQNCTIEEINIPGLICDIGLSEYDGKKYNTEIKKAIRIWPHKNNTEGFFICKIRKIE